MKLQISMATSKYCRYYIFGLRCPKITKCQFEHTKAKGEYLCTKDELVRKDQLEIEKHLLEDYMHRAFATGENLHGPNGVESRMHDLSDSILNHESALEDSFDCKGLYKILRDININICLPNI